MRERDELLGTTRIGNRKRGRIRVLRKCSSSTGSKERSSCSLVVRVESKVEKVRFTVPLLFPGLLLLLYYSLYTLAATAARP